MEETKGEVAGKQAQAPAEVPQQPSFKPEDVPKVTERDHVRGNRKAQIALIEYSDTECPFCSRFHDTANQIVEDYKGKVMWVYRHFPLPGLHPDAQKEAEATECAYDQGKDDAFWKYIDAIFESRKTGTDVFNIKNAKELAVKQGLNGDEFQSCLDSGKHTKDIQNVAAGGEKAGITGTPGNIILNIKTGKAKLIPGALPIEQMKAAIDSVIE